MGYLKHGGASGSLSTAQNKGYLETHEHVFLKEGSFNPGFGFPLGVPCGFSFLAIFWGQNEAPILSSQLRADPTELQVAGAVLRPRWLRPGESKGSQQFVHRSTSKLGLSE